MSSIESKDFLDYESISLLTYIDILNTANYRLVCISGQHSNEECIEAFEKIVERDCKERKSLGLVNIVENYRKLIELMITHIRSKTNLTKLLFTGPDTNVIKSLSMDGISINTLNNNAFIFSINKGFSIIVNMERKIEKLITAVTQNNNDAPKLSAYDLIAELNIKLGLKETVDIKLAMYNAYWIRAKDLTKGKENGRV